MTRYYVVVEGRVQGVGFRYFCQMNAVKLSLTGWVRNMDNGMVEMEIQGTEEALDKFVTTVKAGNRFIRIDDYSIKKIETKDNEKTFKVAY